MGGSPFIDSGQFNERTKAISAYGSDTLICVWRSIVANSSTAINIHTLPDLYAISDQYTPCNCNTDSDSNTNIDTSFIANHGVYSDYHCLAGAITYESTTNHCADISADSTPAAH